MNGDIKENVTRRSIWLRFCFMVIMCAAFAVAEVIVFAVVAFQFLSSLFTGKTNDQLIPLGRNLARYLQQITAYLTFTTEEIPFPFMSWPDEPPEDAEPEEAEPEEAELEEEIEEEVVEKEEEKDERSSAPSPQPPVASVAAPQSLTPDAEAPKDEPDDKIDAPPETTPAASAVADDGKSVDSTDDDDDDLRRNQPEASTDDGKDDTPAETKPAPEPAPKPAQAMETAIFSDGDAYQKFMGERSRLGGEQFVGLLDLPPRLSWLDVGCGTGAFSSVILENCDPVALIGIDRSEEQVAHAQSKLGSAHASFRVGDATRLPFEADSFDVAVSSYVLNFVPDKQKMVDEMARVVRPEGIVAISVFDHAGGRNSSHPFWELIGKRDPAYREAEFDKRGWNITHPDALSTFFKDAGLEEVFVESVEVEEAFADFDDYWDTLTSLPTSGMSEFVEGLDHAARETFKEELAALLQTAPDGGITTKSASWVVRGKVPA